MTRQYSEWNLCVLEHNKGAHLNDFTGGLIISKAICWASQAVTSYLNSTNTQDNRVYLFAQFWSLFDHFLWFVELFFYNLVHTEITFISVTSQNRLTWGDEINKLSGGGEGDNKVIIGFYCAPNGELNRVLLVNFTAFKCYVWRLIIMEILNQIDYMHIHMHCNLEKWPPSGYFDRWPFEFNTGLVISFT